MDLPRCPRCGTAKHAQPRADGLYFCNWCEGLFDNNPDEGGHAVNNDPERNAQSKEEYRLRLRNRQRNQQTQRRRYY